jgi:hypothetical protein
MPRLAPVTTAVLPSNLLVNLHLAFVKNYAHSSWFQVRLPGPAIHWTGGGKSTRH